MSSWPPAGRGPAAAVTGMLAWLTGFALTPPDAKLDNGEQHLAQVLLLGRRAAASMDQLMMWYRTTAAGSLMNNEMPIPAQSRRPGPIQRCRR